MILVVIGSVMLMVALIGYGWLVFGTIVALMLAINMMDSLDIVGVIGIVMKNLPLIVVISVQIGIVVLTLIFSQVSLGMVFTVGGLYVLMCGGTFCSTLLIVLWYFVGNYLVMWSLLPIGLFFLKAVGTWSSLVLIMLVVIRLL